MEIDEKLLYIPKMTLSCNETESHKEVDIGQTSYRIKYLDE